MLTRALVLVAALAGLAGAGCAVGSSNEEGAGGSAAGIGGRGGPGPSAAGTTGTAGSPGTTGNGGTTGSAGAGVGGTRGTGGLAGAGVGGATGQGGAVGGGSGSAGAAGRAGVGGATTTGTGGAGGADPCGAGNPAIVPLPTIPVATFNVTSYGAVGDGRTDNTTALQAALTAAGAAGGGTVTVPAGTFLSGPIVIGSSTRLELSAGAVLKMLPMASYPAGGTAFITSTGTTHDIAITGAGTIDGQGQDWWDAFALDSTILRPQEVNLGHVTRVQISGIRLQNPPEEHIWVKSDTNVTITGITISTLAVTGKAAPKNTDGVDVTANGMFFCNNNIAAGDDNIAMSGSNLYVAYSTFGVGHGCSIGSITQNGVSALTVDHVTFNGTTSGIRMKSARDRGGLVQNLTYSNITMTNVPNPVFITSYYPTLPTDPTTDTAMAITATTPHWQNITIRNLVATGSTNGGILWGLPEAKISTLVFDNVKIQATTGMEIFHATGISFTNGSTVTPRSGAAVTVSDAAVTGVTTTPF
jgi:polygalacturonase